MTFVHISFLLIPHTRFPCRKQEPSKGNACHRGDIGWKSLHQSRQVRRSAYPDYRGGILSGSAHVCAHTRGNSDARNAGFLQKI
jgi:hypothetical protein